MSKKKRKRGRPKSTKNMVMIPLRVEKDIIEALDKLAETDDRSRASYLRRLIQQHIEEQDEVE